MVAHARPLKRFGVVAHPIYSELVKPRRSPPVADAQRFEHDQRFAQPDSVVDGALQGEVVVGRRVAIIQYRT